MKPCRGFIIAVNGFPQNSKSLWMIHKNIFWGE